MQRQEVREFDTFQFKDAIPASCVTIVARVPVAQWRVAFGIGSCVRHSERRNKLRESELRGEKIAVSEHPKKASEDA